jgi:hypothetical protein
MAVGPRLWSGMHRFARPSECHLGTVTGTSAANTTVRCRVGGAGSSRSIAVVRFSTVDPFPGREPIASSSGAETFTPNSDRSA